MREHLWSVNASAVLSVFKTLEVTDGVSISEVAEAERRLGFAIPDVLRRALLLCGRRDDLWRAHHQLLMPHEMKLVENRLPIAYENQGVYEYWIEAGDVVDNPSVHVRLKDAPFAEVGRFATCSDFLDYLVVGHAGSRGSICGGWHTGQTDVTDVEQRIPELRRMRLNSLPFWFAQGDYEYEWVLLTEPGVLIDSTPFGTIVCAATVEKLESISSKLNLQLNSVW